MARTRSHCNGSLARLVLAGVVVAALAGLAAASNVDFGEIKKVTCPSREYLSKFGGGGGDDELIETAFFFSLVFGPELYHRPPHFPVPPLHGADRWAASLESSLKGVPPIDNIGDFDPTLCLEDDGDSDGDHESDLRREVWCRIFNALESLPPNVHLDLFHNDEDWSAEGELEQCQANSQEEYDGLMQFYHSLHGEQWRFHDETKRWGSTDCPCDWEGVGCKSKMIHVVQVVTQLVRWMLSIATSPTKEEELRAVRAKYGGSLTLSAILARNDRTDPWRSEDDDSAAWGDVDSAEDRDRPRRCRGPVTGLKLMSRFLNGTMDPGIFEKLPCLRWINLSCNEELQGVLPETIANASNIQYLAIVQTALSGRLPDGLASLDHLRVLGMLYNMFSGGPQGIDHMTKLWRLRTFIMSDNVLATTIPEDIGNLDKLKALYLSSNRLTGTMPRSFGKLTDLNSLYIHDNQLTGTVPSEFGQLTNLNALRIDYNRLEGELPPIPSPYLGIIQVNENKFTSLPPLLDLYTLLYRFDTASNPINVPLPKLATNRALVSLQLRDCSFTGTLPSEWGQLSYLEELVVMSNENVEGDVPDSFANLTNLKTFNFNNNNLTSIPAFVGDFPFLTMLAVGNNNLKSIDIPYPNQLRNLEGLEISDNNLTEWPEVITYLPSLKWLKARNNQISDPLPVGVMQSLLILALDFADNLMPGNLSISPYAGDNYLRGTPGMRRLLGGNNRLSFDLTDGLFAVPKDLSVFDLSQNDLHGTVAESLFERLPDLVILNFDNNPRISGSLPDTNFRSNGVVLFSALNTSLHLADMRVADVPALLKDPTPLIPKSMTTQPDRDVGGKIPKVRYPEHYACPRLYVKDSPNGKVEVNPEFFGPLCECAKDFLGVVRGDPANEEPCKMCRNTHVSCSGMEVRFNAAGGTRVTPMCAEPFPSCRMEVGDRMWAWGERNDYLELLGWQACTGKCGGNCTLNLLAGVRCDTKEVLTDGSCTPAYRGRRCSECADGFFHSEGECHECAVDGAWWQLLLVVLAITAFAVLTVVQHNVAITTGLLLVAMSLFSVSVLPSFYVLFSLVLLLASIVQLFAEIVAGRVRAWTRRCVQGGRLHEEKIDEVDEVRASIRLLPGLVESLLFFLQILWSVSLSSTVYVVDEPSVWLLPPLNGLECLSPSWFSYFGRFLFLVLLPCLGGALFAIAYAASLAARALISKVRSRRGGDGGVVGGDDEDDEMHTLVRAASFGDDSGPAALLDTPEYEYRETSLTARLDAIIGERAFVLRILSPLLTGLQVVAMTAAGLYFVVALRVLFNFHCEENEVLGPMGEVTDTHAYLVAAAYMPCTFHWDAVWGFSAGGSDEWTWLLITSIVCFVVYVVGFPAALSAALVQLWRSNEFACVYVEEVIGFLYTPFKPQYWYWSSLHALRYVVFAAIVGLFTNSPYLVVVWSAWMLACAALQVLAEPYKTSLENHFAVVALAVVWLFFLCESSLRFDASTGDVPTEFVVLKYVLAWGATALLGAALCAPSLLGAVQALRFYWAHRNCEEMD